MQSVLDNIGGCLVYEPDPRVKPTPRTLEYDPSIKDHGLSYNNIKAIDGEKVDLAAHAAIECDSYWSTRYNPMHILLVGCLFSFSLVVFGICTLLFSVSAIGVMLGIAWYKIYRRLYSFSLPKGGG